ncbi:MAG: YdcH family protein [Hyphomonadaceae bacterium]|nr:YdcH family protein [Hyphomonadaceae bacterium]
MTSASPATLESRRRRLEADLATELKRPLPDFTHVKQLKQMKLRLKDALAAQQRPAPNVRR